MKAFVIGWGVIALIVAPVIVVLLIGYSANHAYGFFVAALGVAVLCIAVLCSVMAWLVGDMIVNR